MSLFNELKRRNVFKVGAAYLVLAWIVIQVADAAVPALRLPDWVNSLVFLLGLLGFPFALFFAWVFELTPDGIKKESEVDRNQSITRQTSNKINLFIIGALVLIIGGMAYERFFVMDTPEDGIKSPASEANSTNIAKTNNKTNAAISDTSIAVLPFSDMSPNKDQEYFSDGISEEILNVLAKIPDLQITSRSSAFSFKGTNTDIPTIAKKLGVANVLEGSVRKAGTTVRITAQLIDARTDKHLWSETYDRELTDIFKVQDEIAAAIVSALKDTLGISISKPEVVAKVIDPQAYDYYLKALQQKSLNTFDSLKAAVNFSNAALKIEPHFSLAKLTLANTLLSQLLTGSESDPALIEQAENLANAVLALEPDLNPAYMTLAFAHFMKGEYKKRIQALDMAYQLDPNNPRSIVLYVSVHKDTISEQQSTQLFNKAQQLDPLNAEIPFSIALSYYGFNPDTRDKAELYYKRAIELNPDDGTYSFLLGILYGESFADIPRAIEHFKTTKKTDPNDPDSSIFLSKSYASLGDADNALAHARIAIQKNPQAGDAYVSQIVALILKGDNNAALNVVHATNNNPEIFHRGVRRSKKRLMTLGVHLLLEKKDYAAAKALVEHLAAGTEQLLNKPVAQSIQEIGNPDAIELLVAIYRAEGKYQPAKQLASRLLLLVDQPIRLRQIDAPLSDQLQLAGVAATQQKNELAIDYLRSVIDGGSILGWRTSILYNPVYAGLHDNPRYQTLIAKIETKMLAQKQIVDERDKNNKKMEMPE